MSHLKLIIDDTPEEEDQIYERNFAVAFSMNFEMQGSDFQDLESICQEGKALIDEEDFKQELCEMVYELIGKRLDVKVGPTTVG